MLHGIRGYNNISDIDFCIQRAGHPGINDFMCTKIIDQYLGTGPCIDLSDPAFYDDHLCAIQHSLAELHAGDGRFLCLFDFTDQGGHLFIHRADDPDHIFCLISHKRFSKHARRISTSFSRI